jgi:hypothetical protein
MTDWTEHDRLKAAQTPPAWTTQPSKVTREDLFNEIDLLKSRLTELDVIFDSTVQARITRIRSLAATLTPKPPAYVCGHDYGNTTCQIQFRSEQAMREHQATVHGHPTRMEGDTPVPQPAATRSHHPAGHDGGVSGTTQTAAFTPSMFENPPTVENPC